VCAVRRALRQEDEVVPVHNHDTVDGIAAYLVTMNSGMTKDPSSCHPSLHGNGNSATAVRQRCAAAM
jgi:hypothetical protein